MSCGTYEWRLEREVASALLQSGTVAFVIPLRCCCCCCWLSPSRDKPAKMRGRAASAPVCLIYLSFGASFPSGETDGLTTQQDRPFFGRIFRPRGEHVCLLLVGVSFCVVCSTAVLFFGVVVRVRTYVHPSLLYTRAEWW